MNDQEVSENLSFFAMLFRVDENPQIGMWLLYGTILVLAIIVFAGVIAYFVINYGIGA